MPKLNKWLEDLLPTMPAHRAFKRSLGTRCKALSYFLRQLKKEEYPSADTIHQLRIWARRTATVLAVFRPVGEVSEWDQFEKTLKQYRHLAGPLRDFDVMVERLQCFDPPLPAQVLEDITQEHAAVLDCFAELAQDKKIFRRGRAVVRRHKKKLVEVAKSSLTQSLKDELIPKLRAQVVMFFERGMADLKQVGNLHQFRIATKELKYTLELAPGVLDRNKVEMAYTRLNDLQERLGIICDLRAAVEWYHALGATLSKEETVSSLLPVIAADERRLKQATTEFLQSWTSAERAIWTHQLQDLIAQAAEVADELDDDLPVAIHEQYDPTLPLDDPDEVAAVEPVAEVPKKKRRPTRPKKEVAEKPPAPIVAEQKPAAPPPKKASPPRKKKRAVPQKTARQPATPAAAPKRPAKKKSPPASPRTTAANRRKSRRPSPRRGSRRG